MPLEKSLLEKIREEAYKQALLNALKHNGKAALGPVISKIVGSFPEIRESVREIIPVVSEIISKVNKLSVKEQEKIIKENWPELLERKHKHEEKKLPPLPNAMAGKVKTRFAPNPDYTIHLGNARPALLSYWYAVEYDGKMILRFEDTDPRTKAPFPEAYDRIKADLEWLGIRWNEEYIQSLRMPVYYQVIKELIERNGAYVDKCPPKVFREYRDAGKPCPHRNQAVEENLEELDKILEGHYGEGEAVIRVKTDLSHPDPSVRDWVAARIIDTGRTPHPVVGERYLLWPTYNLAAATDDHLMGVTHILRAKEHVSNTIKQKYLYDHMGWSYPETIHFGRLSLEGVVLSKSLMRKLTIEKGFEAYSDPRFGTIDGLRRRGITREALWEIIRSVGVNRIDAYISYANLAAINRKIIDPVADRFMAVEDPVCLKITNLPETGIEAHIPRHPGRREVETYLVNPDHSEILVSRKDIESMSTSVFRLMGLGYVEITNTGPQGSACIEVSLQGTKVSRSINAPIIQWVLRDRSIPLLLLYPRGEELETHVLHSEDSIMGKEPGSIIQLYRMGFARIDRIENNSVTAVFSHN